MSYEIAQQILGQLATATEFFTFGYVGINFALYAWKRSGSEAEFSTKNPLLISQAPLAKPLELPQKPLKMPETVSSSLPKPEASETMSFPRE